MAEWMIKRLIVQGVGDGKPNRGAIRALSPVWMRSSSSIS